MQSIKSEFLSVQAKLYPDIKNIYSIVKLLCIKVLDKDSDVWKRNLSSHSYVCMTSVAEAMIYWKIAQFQSCTAKSFDDLFLA